MPYVNDRWQFEDDSVGTRLTSLMSSGNPLVRQARTQAKQIGNRRGLLNSSMTVQAGQTAAYEAALPIASQEAQQVNKKNIQAMGIRSQERMQSEELGSKERIAAMNIGAHDRQYLVSAQQQVEKTYGDMWNQLLNRQNLSAEDRTAYRNHLNALRDSQYRMLEQIYGVDLEWDTVTTDTGLMG